MRTPVPSVPRVSRRAACRFLLWRTGLGRRPGEARPPSSPESVVHTVSALGYVQVDPMRILETSQDLVLSARLESYRPDVLLDLLYRERRLVEVYAAHRCIVPAAHYPVFRAKAAAMERAYRPGLVALEPLMARALARIEAEGPLSSLEFDEPDRLSGWWDPDGVDRTRAIRQALEWLWYFGRLAVSHRAGARRYYDLPERLLGAAAAAGQGDRAAGAEPDPAMYLALLGLYVKALGLVDGRDLTFGWWRHRAGDRRSLLAQAVREGALAEVSIEGAAAPYYVSPGALPELLAAGELEPAPDTGLLAPLDNLIWLRGRTLDLFGFNYTWEGYVPPSKRQYGPYTCPVLHRDQLVGRLDAAMDRRRRTLVVNGLWWEPSVEPACRPSPEDLGSALARLMAVCGADGLEDPGRRLPGGRP